MGEVKQTEKASGAGVFHCDRDNVTACDIQKFLEGHDCV